MPTLRINSPSQVVPIFLVILAGAVPLVGVVLGDWTAVQAVLAVWLELAVGAVFHALREAITQFRSRGLGIENTERSLKALFGSFLVLGVSGLVMGVVLTSEQGRWRTAPIDVLFATFYYTPLLLLPGAIWACAAVARMRRDDQLGLPLNADPRGRWYLLVAFAGAAVVAWLARQGFSALVLLTPVLVLKTAADLWMLHDSPRTISHKRLLLGEELGKLLMLEIEVMRTNGRTEQAAELQVQLDRIWTGQRPNCAAINIFYAENTDWQHEGGDEQTTARIRQLLVVISNLPDD